MFNHCQDFGERIVLTRQANHLGVPGFEKFLFLLLIVFSLFWVLYLRHFAPKAFYVEEIRTFEIELRRYKPEAVPVLHPSVEPDSIEPDSVEPDPIKLDAVIPEIEQSPAATGKPEHEEQSVSKKLTQTQLLEEVMELYRAEHPEWREIPDPDAETYRPDNVFDPRLADRIGSIRKEASVMGGVAARGTKRLSITWVV